MPDALLRKLRRRFSGLLPTLLVTVVLLGALMLGGGIRGTTMAQDQPVPRKPLPKFLRTPALAEKYLNTRDVSELLEFERVEPVCRQLMMRPGIATEVRVEALQSLAELRKKTPAEQLLEILQTLEGRLPAAAAEPPAVAANGGQADATTGVVTALTEVAPLLPLQAIETLNTESTQAQLRTLARTAKTASVRRAAWAAWTQSVQSLEEPWQAAQANEPPGSFTELLESIALLPSDSPALATLKTRLLPILDEASPQPSANEASTTADPQVAAALQATARLPRYEADMLDRVRRFLVDPAYVLAATKALAGIPDATWTTEFSGQRPEVAGELLASLRRMPLEERSREPGQQASRLVERLAAGLPADQGEPLRQQLARIAVRSFTLLALHEKMAYDNTVLVVNPEQPLQVTFDNTDIMPHNWVLVATPAAREETGMAADRMQTEPDALARGYLPASDQILHATRLLSPKQQQTLTFSAPAAPGAYPYLCTFPGHWSRMYGVLLVVPDADAYLATHTTLPSADELLGIRTVQWKEAELLAQLQRLERQPSRENGARLFQRASCYSCHRVGEEGGRVGPELTKIREKYPSQEQLLRHILQPSEKIEPQYASVIAETKEGQVVRGVVVVETDEELRIRENPLDTCEPRVLRKDEIEELSRSPVSPMPENLLNTLVTPEEVHDLLGYLLGP